MVARRRAVAAGGEKKLTNGLYIHSSPPRVLNVSSAHVRQLIRSGDLDKLEQLVIDGRGHKLVGEYSPEYKTRVFLKTTVPQLMSKIHLLHDAVSAGSLEELQNLLQEDVSKRKKLALCKDPAGVGLLHKSIYYDLKDISKWLIENFPQTASLKDAEGRTPIHYTPMCKDPREMQRLLTMAGADMYAADGHGKTCKYYMDNPGELELPSAHIQANGKGGKGGDKDSLVIKPANIRIWIHQKDFGRLQKVLWEGHGAKLRRETSSSPRVKRFLDAVPYLMGNIKEIHMAAINDDLKLMKDKTAEPIPAIILSSKDSHGLTALHKAAGLGHMDIVNFILEKLPTAISLRDGEGRTALHYSVLLKDDDEMYNALLDAGAEEGGLDNRSKTAAYYRTRPNELDAKLLSKPPDAPRTATTGFPPNWDWNLLNPPDENKSKKLDSVLGATPTEDNKTEEELNTDKTPDEAEPKTEPTEPAPEVTENEEPKEESAEEPKENGLEEEKLAEEERPVEVPEEPAAEPETETKSEDPEESEEKQNEVEAEPEEPKGEEPSSENVDVLEVQHEDNEHENNENEDMEHDDDVHENNEHENTEHENIKHENIELEDNELEDNEQEENEHEKNEHGDNEHEDNEQEDNEHEDNKHEDNEHETNGHEEIEHENNEHEDNKHEDIEHEDNEQEDIELEDNEQEDNEHENIEHEVNGHEDSEHEDNGHEDIEDEDHGHENIKHENVEHEGNEHEDNEHEELDGNEHEETKSETPESQKIGVIEGVVNGENEAETLNNDENQEKGRSEIPDEEVTEMVESGNMEQLAALVLNGEGDRLIGHHSDNPEIQAFLENVPIYMTKINRVHTAARDGNLRDLQAALDRRKFAIAKDPISPNGASPLHVATVFGNTSIVRYLAGRFPETLQAQDDNGRTPLHYSATVNDNGHYFNLLLHLGANANATDRFGKNAEYYTTHQADFSHRSLLEEFGAQEEQAEEMLQDKVPDDFVSARRNLDDTDMLLVLDRCYRLLQDSNSNQQVDIPLFKTEEGRYLASSLGDPLIKGLTEVANKRPEDPIAYLATYLFNFSNSDRGRLRTQERNHTAESETPQNPRSIDVVTLDPDEQGEIESDAAFSASSRDEHGQSMLHFAAARSHGRNALFQLLQETDINIGYRDELYRTARDVSIQANVPENTHEIDRYVISIAARGDTDKLVELLLEGYDHIIDIVDEEDTPITEVVANREQASTVSFLHSILAFEERRERVHHAIRQGNLDQVKEMLADEHGTGSGKLLAIGKNSYGRCTLHIAVLCQQEEIVDFVANSFTDSLYVGDNLERTALHYAMGVEQVESISRVLIEAGAKRVIKDLKGRQASYYFMNKSDILRLQEEEETF